MVGRSIHIARESALQVALAMLLVLSVLVALPGTAQAVDAAYVDVASAVGISNTHSPGDLCVPPIGAGAAWADADGDGDVDVFITQRDNTLPNKLFQNVGDTVGTPDGLPDFVEIAAAAGVADTASYALSSVFVDYDNDGDQDLYVTNHPGEGVAGGNNKLFQNTGNNGDSIPDFVDVTAAAGLADGGRAITSGWADFNNDGWLDMYVARHRKCGTANVDSQDHLYMSDGDGTFTDVTGYLCPGGVAPCDDVNGLGFSPGWFDYDNDGDQDLYVANDNIGGGNQNNKLWRNDGSDGVGGWIFTYVGATSGADTQANAMGLGIGDYNNDGTLDLAFSDVGSANLINNNGDGTFTDVSTLNGFDTMTDSVTWGTAFMDSDNDGDLDLFYAAGQIGTGGLNSIYLTNDGDGTFTDTSVTSGLNDSGSGLAASMVDFDNDGWVDLMVNNYGGTTLLMRNNGSSVGNTNNWLKVTVEGTESNRDGIGTRIEYTTGAGTQIREISSGPTHGGGDQRVAHFGVGTESTGTLTVKWPNGQTTVMASLATNQALHLVEPATAPVYSDVSAAVGINFTHSLGTECDPPIGNGSAWADADGDGDVDLFITQRNNGQPNALYLNVGDTVGPADGLPDFMEVAATAGVDHPTATGLGAVFVDIDNDGDQDLFVSNLNDNKLYRNDGNDGSVPPVPIYADISAAAGIVDFGRAITPSFGDFDNDGFLDLYLPKHLRCGGETEDAEDKLFHNNGDNTFTDVTGYLCAGGVAPCADTEGLGFSAAWFDYDNDGDQDLYLVNDNIGNVHQVNRLWRNDGSDGVGGWLFAEVSAAAGADKNVNGMGLGVADYDNDGDFDVAFSNAAPGKLLSNDGDGTFTDLSGASGVVALTTGVVTWGAAFFDYDNDMWQDLYFIGGNIHTTGQPNVMGRNNGSGFFDDVSVATGLDDDGRGRAVTTVDFDGDGFMDVFVPNYNGPAALYRNNGGDQGNTNASLVVTVEGTDSNSDGIGTVLELTAGGVTQRQRIGSGESHGGGSERIALFGLGGETSGTLTAYWPNGLVSNLGTVTAGSLHAVEPTVGPSGSISGHVFDDANGNGTNDAEAGLVGVSVSVTDANSVLHNATTNAAGSFSISGVAVGSATVTFTTPAGKVLTTSNDVQVVSIADGATTATADVGYAPLPSGGVSVRVFNDANGNGTDDGETGLNAVAVSVTDANSVVFNGTTDTSGNVTFSGLAVGSATLTVTGPVNYTLTSGNDVQVVTVVDGVTTAASAVGYETSGTPPDLISVLNPSKNLSQGTARNFRIDSTGVQTGAVWSVSGTEVTVFSAVTTVSGWRVRLVASATAAPGLRDLTVVNPDGLSDTLTGAINIVGTTPSPTGSITGHVFTDVDGNGVEDGADTALAGVSVTITATGGGIAVVTTDGSGNYTASGLAVGSANVDYATPASHVLTAGTDPQTITVVDATTVTAAPVGYQPIPSGDVNGHVFLDEDGSGAENGAEGGLAGVTVNATDFNGSVFSTTTDGNGDYTLVGLAVGNATVTFVTPSSHTLTTANDVQVVAVADGSSVATAAVGYEPPVGTPPVINSIINPTKTINQGATKNFVVSVSNHVVGAVWTFSGTGLTVTNPRVANQGVRITVTATASAGVGFHDLTVTNPDGLSDTLVNAIEVIGVTVTGNLFR